MSLKNAVLRGEDASMEEVWEGVLWRMAVQAVPTLLSCLAFMSFSPLFFVSSIPFSVLFVTLSVLISVASWCWSPTEGGGASVTTTDNNKCKLGTRSWWCCGEAPRGFQLAMLVLTWALLLLLLCMPLMAKAEIGQVDHAVTQDLDDEGQEIVAQVLKESGVDTGAESGDAEKRPDEEPQSHQQSSFDSSADSSPQSELLPSCRTLVRLGEQVTCAAAPPALSSPAPKYVSSEFGATSTLCGQHPVFPPFLLFGQQPLHQSQANSQLLVLHNSGQQVVQIEDIYELSGDSKLKIDYEKGQILRPNSKKEVANVTYSGQNQSVTCMKAQKIIVHTNSTIDHLIEIPYTAMVLQCLHSPPAMAFGTGSPGSAGDLGGSQQLGFTDLLMNGKVVFMGLVICVGLICGLIFFHPVVLDANLPTFSNECHGRSPLIMKKRDKITKMRGWGALATVADGVWTAFGSSLWTNKDCTTPAPDYTLPRFVTPPSSPASPSAATTASKKGKKGRKNNNNAAAAKSGLPFTSNHHHHHHHGPSVYQPKASKFLRPENPAKHLVYADQHVKDDVALAPVVPEAEPGSPVADPKPDAPIEEPAKKTLDVLTATGTPLEKRKRKKKSNKCSHLGTISPASPSSPVAPSWFSSPPSPGKKSDQSSSPRSVDLAVPELKVKILHSPTKVTDSPKMEPPQPPRKQPLPFERPRVLPRKNEPAPAPVLAPRKKAPASTGYFHRSLFTEPTDYDGSQTFRRPHPQPITAFGAAPGSPYRRDSEAFVAPPPPLAPPPPPPPRPLPSPIARPKKHESWASLGITEDGQPPLYDIWGNYFGDLDLDALSEPLEYPHPPLQPGEISPIGAALYASGFQSYFSEPGTFDFHPAPPAPLPASPAPLPAPQVAVKPFVKPPPYTPPMGGPNRYYPLAFNPQQSNIWAFDSSTDYNNNNNNNWASDYSGGGGSSSSSGGTRRRVPESRVPPPSLPPYNQPPYKW